MRSTRRRRRGGSDGSFWLSFSDLMSSLVLIIILVMFYIIYQYFNLAEINEAEIARRQYQLDRVQEELTTQQGKLTEAEKKMVSQQILLNAKEEELSSAQSILTSQKEQLASAQSQLDEQKSQILDQQLQMGTLSSQLDEKQRQIEETRNQLIWQQETIDEAQRQLLSQQATIEETQKQLDSQQRQLEALVGMKTRIITSLSDAFRSEGISVTVDPSNGSITLESDILFRSAKYDLTEAGKNSLDQVLPVYLNVLFSEEYYPYLAEIIIEGHTDSDGSWLDNLELSQQRALAVAEYVLGDDCASLSRSTKWQLQSLVTVNGRSYSDPVYTIFGREDKDASRRVMFKFRLTDEQMITQLREILENN